MTPDCATDPAPAITANGATNNAVRKRVTRQRAGHEKTLIIVTLDSLRQSVGAFGGNNNHR
jgi:hypothetical protein